MITPGDIEVSEGREATGGHLALWAAVLREVVVVKRDLAYLDSEDFRYVCQICAMEPEWVAKKLRAAIANKTPKLHDDTAKASVTRNEASAILETPGANHRPQARRTHTEATRAKIRAAIARRREDTAAYTEWCAAMSAGQTKRWSRARDEMQAA